ncbi:MAG: hypothetical protein IKJ41_10850 [Clostridia bacterium]|nr:hypothetical protein [Clostridia bacterium]
MNEFFKNLIWRWFGKKILESFGQIQRSETDCTNYTDISAENITALLANSVSNIAMGDSQVFLSAIGGGSTRFSDILSEIAEKEWTDISDTVACALGCGAIISIPYSVDNGLGRKIYIDTVMKDRFFVTGMQGDEITQCVILADEFVRDNKSFKRFTDYSVKDGVYIIRNRAVCNDTLVSLTTVEEWADIPEQIAIGGVKQLPIAILRCPQNPRRPKAPSGVPITFGCDATLNKIAKTLNDIEREFDKKKSKVFADRSMIQLHKNKDGKSIDPIQVRKEFENNDLYIAFNDSDKSKGVEIFDPAFRDSAYYNKLEKHFAMLEKECGLSEGVLTKLSTSHATATEIFRVMYNTFCFCGKVNASVTKYFKDLMYACSVLINYYGMAPYSEYDVKFSYSFALLEDSSATFSQKMQAESIGAEDIVEIRQFIHPEETREEAQAVIDRIRETRPTVTQLINEE